MLFSPSSRYSRLSFFFQGEDSIRGGHVTGVQTCALPIYYAASLKAQETAEENDYAQVLWLDGVEKRYVEEVGSMNVFFKIAGEIVTPALNDSILEGVTRHSVLQLLHHWDLPVTERRISMDEIKTAYEAGTLEEAFGTGTAAVISPIGALNWDGYKMDSNGGETGPIARRLYDTITGIQLGTLEDPFEWIVQVD